MNLSVSLQKNSLSTKEDSNVGNERQNSCEACEKQMTEVSPSISVSLKKEVLAYTTWINSENIMPSEVSPHSKMDAVYPLMRGP